MKEGNPRNHNPEGERNVFQDVDRIVRNAEDRVVSEQYIRAHELLDPNVNLPIELVQEEVTNLNRNIFWARGGNPEAYNNSKLNLIQMNDRFTIIPGDVINTDPRPKPDDQKKGGAQSY